MYTPVSAGGLSGSKLYRHVTFFCDMGSIAKSIARLTAHPRFESQLSHVSLVEIDNEIISTAILLLPRIQERQFSVIVERVCTSTS